MGGWVWWKDVVGSVGGHMTDCSLPGLDRSTEPNQLNHRPIRSTPTTIPTHLGTSRALGVGAGHDDLEAVHIEPHEPQRQAREDAYI